MNIYLKKQKIIYLSKYIIKIFQNKKKSKNKIKFLNAIIFYCKIKN